MANSNLHTPVWGVEGKGPAAPLGLTSILLLSPQGERDLGATSSTLGLQENMKTS